MTSRIRTLLLVPLAITAGPAALSGQECAGGTIHDVEIDNQSIFDTSEMDDDASFRWAYDLANTLHMDTRESFVRAELLFREGDCYDPLLLAESERLLRNYDFIARAEIDETVRADGTRGVRVRTRDEWTTQLNVGVAFQNGFRVEGVELREENFLGRGFRTGFFFRERRERRDLGVMLATPRLFSTRWDATFSAGRTRTGSFLSQSFVYPFVAEVGRMAARQTFASREILFPYSAPGESDITHVLLPYKREAVELTAAGRIGRPGNLTIFGLGILRESTSFPGFPDRLEVARAGDFSDTAPAEEEDAETVANQVDPTTIFRLNFLLGQRNVRFAQRSGLDALTGVQDIRLGTEISMTIGRALGDVGSGRRDAPDDLYTRLYAFGGWAPGDWVVATRGNLEGRVVFPDQAGGTTVRDVLGQVDGYLYWKPSGEDGHTLFGRISGSGGWSVQRPFQLTLGGRSDLRGYRERAFPGARRLLVTIEDRVYFRWPAPDLFDFGLGVFADAGRIWAGSAPHGHTSSWQASVGAGLRIGFPSGTRSVARVDVAFPMTGPDRFSSPVFRINLGEVLGLTAGFDSEEIERSRRPAVGADLLAEEAR